MRPHFAAISPDGRILGLEDSAQAAIELVNDRVGGPISVQELPDEPESNPPDAEQMPMLSERNCQIPRFTRDDALLMPLDEAHARLKPFFSGLISKHKETKKYNTASGMADGWIGQNYKTEKPSQDPGRPAEVMGLTLVPASHARLASLASLNPPGSPPYENPYDNLFDPGEKDNAPELRAMKRTMLARWKEEIPQRINAKFTFCQGSSRECRDSCLVFAGQNASTRYNTYRKVAQTMALLNEPAAFMRMLVESIGKWIDDCTFYKRPQLGMEIAPFFRMNVLSDIPWERIAPWFFDFFSGRAGENGKQLRFYDYTKVPDRRAMSGFPKNYDLTFSLSGTPANKLYAQHEIAKYNSRIAVVFLAKKQAGDKDWTTFLGRGQEYQDAVPLPERFWGMPVRDGDLSDVRPHDSGGVCVGLRWKIPSGKRSGQDPDYENMSFVTPIYVESADKPSGLERPNPSDNDDLVLVAPTTPRFMPIVHR